MRPLEGQASDAQTRAALIIELNALRLALEVMACHVAVVIAPTSRSADIQATLLQLYWDLRPLAEYSNRVDAALDVIARADCDEEDTLDLERVARQLIELRKRISAANTPTETNIHH